MKLDARVGQRDFHIAGHLVQQLAQLVHRLSRDDHARHRARAFGQWFLHPCKAMAVGGHRAEHPRAFAFGGMHVDAVQIVACFFGADGEARSVYKGTQRLRREVEPVRQGTGGHRGEILGRQHHEAGGVAPGVQRQLGIATRVVELHLRSVG